MLLKVSVEAGAKRETVTERGKRLLISVKEKAQENRANTRVRAIVAERLHVPLSAVRIMRGHRTSSKLIQVSNAQMS